MTTPSAPDSSDLFLDPKMPNTARIFNYMLGGRANFEADRAAAEQILQLVPSLSKWVRLRHACALETAQVLYEEGFKQFLDIASGIPTRDHIHVLLPDAIIVYSDINPVALSYGTNVVAGLANVRYVHANAVEIDTLLTAPAVREVINPSLKVAIGLNSLFLFLKEEQIRSVAQRLHQWASSRSKVFLTVQVRSTPEISPEFEHFLEICRQAKMPIWLPTLDEILTWMEPWRPILMEPVANFLGLPADFVTDADHEGIGMEFYAAIFEK
jgi:hypothetical protein